MGQDDTEDQHQECDEEEANQSDETSDGGRSRYARNSIDSGIGEWLRSKEEKRSKPASQGLSRGNGLKKSRLNPVSKKQKKRNADYKEALESHYSKEENRQCKLCGTTNNLSNHHKKKRGKNIDDELYFVTLCIIGDYMDRLHPDSNSSGGHGCHGWVHANHKLAKKLKLIL